MSKPRIAVLILATAVMPIAVAAGILGSAGFRLISLILIGACFIVMFAMLLLVMGHARDFYREEGHSVRRTPGTCPECGYDLSGNRSGICPECGTAVTGPHPTPKQDPKASIIRIADLLAVVLSLAIFFGGLKLTWSRNESASSLGIVAVAGFGAATVGFIINIVIKLLKFKGS